MFTLSPQLERHRETHNYKTLGKEEKFQATKMVSNDARKSVRLALLSSLVVVCRVIDSPCVGHYAKRTS